MNEAAKEAAAVEGSGSAEQSSLPKESSSEAVQADDLGTKELEEVVNLGAQLGIAIDKTLADGKVSLGDAVNLIDVVKAVPAAVDGFTDALKEAKDLDSAELAKLQQVFAEKFKAGNALTEELVEASMAAALGLGRVVLVAAKIRKAKLESAAGGFTKVPDDGKPV